MHLHNHSQYSVIDGRGKIADYIKLAHEDGQTAFALTDHGTLGGIIDLYTTAKKYDVKPIAGIEIYVDAFELRERNYPGHLTVLAKNEQGYRALIAANNLAHRQFYYRPRVTMGQLVDGGYLENWIVLSGCMSSPIFHHTLTDAENMVRQLNSHSAAFFLEAMWHYSEDAQFEVKQQVYLERLSTLHKLTNFPVVLTNDCHYAHKYDEDLHNQFLKSIHSDGGLEFDGEEFYFKKQEAMQGIANALGIPNSIANAVDICNMCDLVIPEADKVNWHVPDITGGQPATRLRALVSDRLSSMSQPYKDRFEYEMSVLETSPAILNSYMVTKDLVDWCTDHDIIAAARGSMAGSLVSHLLGITKEDPIKYGLSFSRAVNPARPSIPDFDLDVSSHRRGEILDYLKNRYAGNIPIVSYTHYGPKGALRKILRMENIRNPTEVNAICKELPDDWTGDSDFEYSPQQHRFVGNQPWTENVPEQYQSYVALYQGLYSSMGVHPSGVLISGPERPIEHEVPFQWIASSNALTSALDMYSLKKIGLFKLDVLGLKTLDQLKYMEHMSGAVVPNDDYDEPEVLAAFGADLLSEIFQMDGYACRSVLKDIRGVQTFEDIIAANTLARPGCSQFTPWYRSGYENLLREYPPLVDILGPTNGLILYQEQVMEIARILADFDDAEQDDVKESIKYFRKENWAKTIEPLFRERCEAKGFNATNILEAISRMASYTYNRAHAMTYAAIAYKMMWYKVHYPAVFYASVFDGCDDRPRLVLESHFFGIKWRVADINESQSETIVRGNEILLGLSAIKGVGPAAFAAIAKVRPFTSMDDLLTRVERKRCNKAVVKSLAECFALDSIGEHGSFVAFEKAFGFNYRYLNAHVSVELVEWQEEQPDFRLGGFVVDLRPFTVKNLGPNHGKEMARAKIVNVKATKTAIFFPDTWKKARGILYQGAAVELLGTYQTSGDFIAEKGATRE
jgi:DNA polymerase-3 subunit alpha